MKFGQSLLLIVFLLLLAGISTLDSVPVELWFILWVVGGLFIGLHEGKDRGRSN